MNDKSCIIIDDEPQDEIVENLKADARHRGIQLSCVQLNPQDQDYEKDVGDNERPEYVIDIEKVIEKLKTIGCRRVDVIACDYFLQDDNINGFDIIHKLRNQLHYKKEIILYSANLETVIREILLERSVEEQLDRIMNLVKANIPENLEAGIREILTERKFRDQITRIKNLTRANILAFTDKDKYRASILAVIQQDLFSLEAQLDSLLNKYSSLLFKTGYPPLSGKILSEIIAEIDQGTADGKEFQKAILENAIAHMVQLNKEDDG